MKNVETNVYRLVLDVELPEDFIESEMSCEIENAIIDIGGKVVDYRKLTEVTNEYR